MSFGNVASAGDSLKSGLVGWYRMLGGVTDSSGRGNNGTAYGSPTLASDKYGNSNAAYSFVAASTQYISLPIGNGLPAVSQGAAFSMAFWMKCPTQSTSNCMYGEGDSGDANGYFNLFVSSNHQIIVWWSTADGTTIFGNGKGTATIDDGNWHHIVYATTGAGTSGGSTSTVVYVDGSPDAESSGGNWWNWTAAEVHTLYAATQRI